MASCTEFLGRPLRDTGKAPGGCNRPITAMAEFGLRRSIGALTIALALTACDSGYAAGDRDEGIQLARQWCSGCHSVESASQGSDAAPTFDSIAIASGGDKAWLKAWLSSAHPTMPDMNLSREEIDDIVAYLSSLSRP